MSCIWCSSLPKWPRIAIWSDSREDTTDERRQVKKNRYCSTELVHTRIKLFLQRKYIIVAHILFCFFGNTPHALTLLKKNYNGKYKQCQNQNVRCQAANVPVQKSAVVVTRNCIARDFIRWHTGKFTSANASRTLVKMKKQKSIFQFLFS